MTIDDKFIKAFYNLTTKIGNAAAGRGEYLMLVASKALAPKKGESGDITFGGSGKRVPLEVKGDRAVFGGYYSKGNSKSDIVKITNDILTQYNKAKVKLTKNHANSWFGGDRWAKAMINDIDVLVKGNPEVKGPEVLAEIITTVSGLNSADSKSANKYLAKAVVTDNKWKSSKEVLWCILAFNAITYQIIEGVAKGNILFANPSKFVILDVGIKYSSISKTANLFEKHGIIPNGGYSQSRPSIIIGTKGLK
jgi:hypothetical protein